MPTPNGLDAVLYKCDTAASNMALFQNLSMDDRINATANPLSNNYTGSAKGLVQQFPTQQSFGGFDETRPTPQTIADRQECMHTCIPKCLQSGSYDQHSCVEICKQEVCNQRKDYI